MGIDNCTGARWSRTVESKVRSETTQIRFFILGRAQVEESGRRKARKPIYWKDGFLDSLKCRWSTDLNVIVGKKNGGKTPCFESMYLTIWHSWHFCLNDPLLWGLALGIEGWLAECLASTHQMTVALPNSHPEGQSQIYFLTARCPLGGILRTVAVLIRPESVNMRFSFQCWKVQGSGAHFQ